MTDAITPVIFAPGPLTTAFSFAVIGVFLLTVRITGLRRASADSGAGKGTG